MDERGNKRTIGAMLIIDRRGRIVTEDDGIFKRRNEFSVPEQVEKKSRHLSGWPGRRLSLFEKVILANSVMLIGEALAGLWVTSHNIESHHYVIDTGFIVVATLIGLVINVFLLRASFRPLFSLLATMRAVSSGKTTERATDIDADSEIGELAQTFNAMLDSLEAARREQSIVILQAQEEERRHLALELHDESGQNLTALLVHIAVLQQKLQSLPDAALIGETRQRFEREFEYLNTVTQQTLDAIRVLAQQLRPSVLDDLGLSASFRWLAEDVRQRLHLTVTLHMDDIEQALRTHPRRAMYETALFRIAQESLTNIARHAQAQHVSISLKQEHDRLRLRIHDDGHGFDPATQKQGLGLLGIRERAALLNGTVQVESQQGQGTTIQALLPLSITSVEGKTHG